MPVDVQPSPSGAALTRGRRAATRRLVAFAVLAAILLGGCEGLATSSEGRPLAGTYVLQTINGQALPFQRRPDTTLAPPDTFEVITAVDSSATIVLRDDGSYAVDSVGSLRDRRTKGTAALSDVDRRSHTQEYGRWFEAGGGVRFIIDSVRFTLGSETHLAKGNPKFPDTTAVLPLSAGGFTVTQTNKVGTATGEQVTVVYTLVFRRQ